MSKKDLIEQNITRVQEYMRELIEDAKWNNGVSETLESTSIIVGNSDDIYDFAILFASNSECVYCEFINGKIEDRKSTRLNSSHDRQSRMPSSA